MMKKKQIVKFLKTLGIDYNGSYKISPGEFLTMYDKFLEKESKKKVKVKKTNTKAKEVNEYLYWV